MFWPSAVGYLNLCFQTWHGNIAPLSWEFSVSPPAKTGATLFVRLSPSLTRKYTVPATYKGKKDAKEAVAKKAIKDGLLGLIRPKKSDFSRTHLRGGMVGRGGSSFDRGGTFNNRPFFPQSQLPASQLNTISPSFQVPHMQPALGGPSMTGSNIFAAQGQQMLDSQQHNPFMIQQRLQQQQAEQQRFGNQSGSGMYNNGMQNQQPGSGAFSWVAPNQQQPGNATWGIPPHDQMMQIVQQLDDFCLEWMGPGHLPQYEVHRDERTGLFGCGVRIPITPANIKSFWTRHEFTARNDAQEACARIAMQDGIIDTVKREFPPMTNLSSPMPAPSMGSGGMNTASQGGLGVFGFNGSNAFPNMHTGQGGFQQGGRGAGAFGRGGAFTGRGGTQTRPIKSNNTSSSAKGAPHKTVASHSESKSRKGESAVTQLNKTCQYVIGSEPQDMPEYEFLTDTTGSKFGAVVHVPLDSNQTTVFSIPSSFTSKREAKEAVAKLAIDQGVLQQIKDKAEKRIDQIQSSLKDANQPYSPLKIGQKPQSDRPKTFVHQLQEFTRSHNLPKPVFTSETGPAQEGGDGKEQVLRVWVVIGDLKFELDKERFGKEHDGKERLAARVLKHLQKEESERLAASTS
ncbi:hypothetical protein BT69DRAFT_98272 [Atractiella rhizophila]|nr:hypothetical protein BT69DRAFT_98272 [Atractiella rhizophila]